MPAVVIKDLLPQPRQIALGGDKTVSVRGITLQETIVLLDAYKGPLMAFFGAKDLDFGALAISAPEMVAKVIGMGLDAQGQEDDIRKMPLQMQVDILTEVWEQSVPNVRKLLASLGRASESLKVAQSTHQPSITSFPSSSTLSSEQATV